MKKFTSQKQKTGLVGEVFAKTFLMKHGFSIIETNFSCRFGEIDIIAQKNEQIYFVEVKSVVLENFNQNKNSIESVSRGTSNNKRTVSRETFINQFRRIGNPFQNISYAKVRRLIKTAEIYLSYRKVPRETRWQVDGVGIYLNDDMSLNNIDHIQNITIP